MFILHTTTCLTALGAILIHVFFILTPTVSCICPTRTTSIFVLAIFIRATAASTPTSIRTTVQKIKSFDVPLAKPVVLSQFAFTIHIAPTSFSCQCYLTISKSRIRIMHDRFVIIWMILSLASIVTLCVALIKVVTHILWYTSQIDINVLVSVRS